MLGSSPCSRNTSDLVIMGWNCQIVWMGGCRLKQNLGVIKPIATEILVVPDLLGFIIDMKRCFG